jgi:type IV secretion system protein VirB10
MRLNHKLPLRGRPEAANDPREAGGAEIIDLATRNVLPSVTQRKPRSELFGLAAGIALVAVLGGVTLWSLDSARVEQQQIKAGSVPAPGTPVPGAPVDAAPPVPAVAITPASGAPLPAPAPQPVLAAQPQGAVAVAPAANPYSSPTIVFDASALPAPFVAPTGAPVAAPLGASEKTNDDFASRIGGIGGGPATASVTIDPKTTVTQGTLIPAILETAIDTDVPGYVRAVVSTDVRSFDGSRVLIPRSSRLIGQYKSGLQAGQKRAYVIWTRLIRPDGASVNIASPAVGFGGQTGLAGKVDTHFFERFGSAMLLSVVEGLSTLGGMTSVLLGGGQSAAAAAIGQTGQIGPTVRVRQGEPIRVFTARDLDFSRVSPQ